MKLKKGDKVIVISGKDRGKTGEIVRAFPNQRKVIISGINLKKVHKRATKSGQKGQIVEQASPIHVSNVSIVDPKDGKPTRISFSINSDKKVRIARRSKTTLS